MVDIRRKDHAWEIASTIALLAALIYLLLRGRAAAAGQSFPGLPGIDYPFFQAVPAAANVAPAAGATFNLGPDNFTLPNGSAASVTGGATPSCGCQEGGGAAAFGSAASQAAWFAANLPPGLLTPGGVQS